MSFSQIVQLSVLLVFFTLTVQTIRSYFVHTQNVVVK